MILLYSRSSLFLLLLCAGLSACVAEDGQQEAAIGQVQSKLASVPDALVAENNLAINETTNNAVPVANPVATTETPDSSDTNPEQLTVTDGLTDSDSTDTADEVVDVPEEQEEIDGGSDEETIEEPVFVVPEDPVVNLDVLHNYSNQPVPFYIQKDNTTDNIITDAGATLGRVLFCDRNLSGDNSVSCSSCHQQSTGFSDRDVVSVGVNGSTGRHSMRLVDARFSDEEKFFWDERAATLEIQTTQPVRDHAEMGFSGEDNAPDFTDLTTKLSGTAYYESLFVAAYGNSVVTEEGIQDALARFIRSLQSFDSRYDQGRVKANGDRAAFTNFTAVENEGKRLFMDRVELDGNTGQRIAGTGLGCQTCHPAPEFDIDPNARNNGVISVAGDLLSVDTTVTGSPSLRDLFSAAGVENGPFMHDGSLATFDDVLDHYNEIVSDRNLNRNLDGRLTSGRQGAGLGQRLMLTDVERAAITAFIKALGGSNLYTDEKWSDPFDENGELVLMR